MGLTLDPKRKRLREQSYPSQSTAPHSRAAPSPRSLQVRELDATLAKAGQNPSGPDQELRAGYCKEKCLLPFPRRS